MLAAQMQLVVIMPREQVRAAQHCAGYRALRVLGVCGACEFAERRVFSSLIRICKVFVHGHDVCTEPLLPCRGPVVEAEVCGANVFFQPLFGFERAAAGVGAGPGRDVVQCAWGKGAADEGPCAGVDSFEVGGKVRFAGEGLAAANVVGADVAL